MRITSQRSGRIYYLHGLKYSAMATPIRDTWEINHRITIYLLESLTDAQLSAGLSSKGRSAGEQFAHIHNVRLMWLKVAMPEAMEGLEKLEKDGLTTGRLTAALNASAAAMTRLMEKGDAEGKIKGFKPHATAFLGYMIAHEAHHRSQIILALKQAGVPADKKILYGIWEWGVR